MSVAPRPYDHVRSEGTPVDAGTYRVVGVADDRVTLLRVADASGKRVHVGQVVYVSLEEYGRLEAASNPDEPSLARGLAVATVGAALVFVGSTPESLASLGIDIGTGLLADGLVFVGVLALVVGVRRLVRYRRLKR
ncbi:hypothetical protein SAMN04487950_0061 [Halogranum rubrum]|uniref:Uncharacterized protein n=1 Tax=Halogranum rubrum TaxID=553466 RepID=A0A1I4ATS1_9EURY|nr:hypothetical protein [Halogranum rubrum]SFK59046.1 hypothetical protein SAMN04487950_0061 [Halogranum rubrum]